MYDLVCVGDIFLDIITSPLKKYPEKETQAVSDFLYSRGGEAANCAALASKLGLKSCFMGAVGKDFIGNHLVEELRKDRVYFEGVRKGKSAVTFAVSFPDGSRSFITQEGSNLLFFLQDVDFRMLKNARHVHRGGYWHTEKLLGKPNEKLFRFCRRNSIKTSLNIGWDFKGWPDIRSKQLLKLLKYVDIFFLNSKEARALTGKDYKKAVEEFDSKISAVHLGKKGSYIYSEGEGFLAKAERVKVVNPVGAGDAFNAGFIYGRLKNWDLEKTGEFANRTAARHISGKMQ